MEVTMKKFLFALCMLVFASKSEAFTYKINYLYNKKTDKFVALIADFHEDMICKDGVKKQVKDIIKAAQNRDAHILIEDIFDYTGNNTVISSDSDNALLKYWQPVYLLRDVHDLAKKRGLSVDNMEYRREMEYSLCDKGVAAQDAFAIVDTMVKKVKSFDDTELKQHYKEFIDEFVPVHKKIKAQFVGHQTIAEQVMKPSIKDAIMDLTDKMPVTCEDDPRSILQLYDARLMNQLMLHRIYQLQCDPTSKKTADNIFVVAGAFHTDEVSDALQKYLGYELIDQTIGENNQEALAGKKPVELVQIDTFFKNQSLSDFATVDHTRSALAQTFGISLFV